MKTLVELGAWELDVTFLRQFVSIIGIKSSPKKKNSMCQNWQARAQTTETPSKTGCFASQPGPLLAAPYIAKWRSTISLQDLYPLSQRIMWRRSDPVNLMQGQMLML